MNAIRTPEFEAGMLTLLERLCNACGISGEESEVRAIVLEQVQEHADEVKVDALGNVLVKRMGTEENRLRVMLAAHMDEVGLMISAEDEDGTFRFETVGGLDSRQLPGKAVQIGRDHIPGVIGAKPIHHTTTEEMRSAISLETLRIDVGPGNHSKVKIGDRAAFATRFQRIGPSLRAKALDDRLGVATLIELVKNPPKNIDLLAAFTVQEEIGARGARVAAYALDPDLAMALDCTPANDLPPHDYKQPGSENTRYNTRLGAGPAIYLMDSGTINDPRLVRHFVVTAENQGIPYQFRQPGGGGTDARAIHKQRVGIPSLSLSVPGRYLHTAVSIARLDDWVNSILLVAAALENLSPDVLAIDR